jgi:hypothetical protein
MMQDMMKAYLAAIAGAAGFSTWKLIQRYKRILAIISAGVIALMSISVLTLEAPIIPPSGIQHPGVASVSISGWITMALVGDTVRCRSGDVSWSPLRVQIKPRTVSQLCIAP